MNGLQDLISKLQKIEEKVTLNPDGSVPPTETVTLPNGGTIVQRAKDPAAAPAAAPAADPQRAAYDQFKADDAKKAAIETVKKYMSKPIDQIGRLENLIDAKTGFIYYGQAGMDASKGTPTKMPMKFMSQGDQKSMMDAITAAGLKVVDSGGYAMIDPASLKTLGQAPAATTTATTTTPATTPPSSDQKPAPTADADKAAKVKRFTELLTKAGVITAPPAAPTPGNTDVSKGAVDYNLAPQTATGPGIKLPPAAPVKESITFKSSIGKLLLESGALTDIVEAAATSLSKEEYSELSKLYGDLSVTYKDDATLAPLFTAYNKVPPTWSSAPTTTPTATDPKKKTMAPVDPGTKELQKWLISKGYDVGPTKDDGRWGPNTQKAIDAWTAKGLKPGNPEWEEFNALANKAKDTDWTRQWWQKTHPEDRPKAPATGKPAPASPAQVGSDQKAAPTSTGNPNLDVLNTVKDPKQGQEHWVNGSRFIYRSSGFNPQTGQPNPGNGWYKNLDPNDKLIGSSGKYPNQTMVRVKYTGPDADDAAKEKWLAANKPAPVPVQPGGARAGGPMAAPVKSESVGFADDELNRLVSLIHHR